MAPPKGVVGLKHRNTKKNIQKLFLLHLLTEILEIWYVALSCGPLLNLYKMVLSQGILGLQVKYT